MTPPLREERHDREPESIKLNIYDIGVQLEEATAAIFEKMGYSVKMRQRPPTKSGGTAEIDILLERGNRRKAVECKNYDPSRSVGVSELRIFKDKLTDTGIAAGVFVTTTSFSEDAERLAESTGIERWDGDEKVATAAANPTRPRVRTTRVLCCMKPSDNSMAHPE